MRRVSAVGVRDSRYPGFCHAAEAARMAIHLDLTLPPGSSSLPGGSGEQPSNASCLALLPMRLAMRPTVTSGPVVSYTAVSPLPGRNRAVCSLLR